MSKGTIKRIMRERGFGFILAEDGREIFFHRSELQDVDFDKLEEGDTVIITFHIIYIEYDEDYDGYTTHMEGEYPKEQWDSSANEPSYDPLPQSIIKKA